MITFSFITGLLMGMTGVQGGAEQRSGVYVARVNGAAVAQERYRFDGVTLTAELTLAAQGLHLSTETRFNTSLSPEHYAVVVRSAADGPAVQQVEVAFTDSARWTATGQGQTQRGTTPLPSPFMVLQNLQFSHIAVALLRYDRAKGGTQRLSAWLPRGAAVVPVEVALTGDSGVVHVAGQVINVWLDGSGWLTKATQPAQGLTVERQDRAEPLAAPAPPRAGTADTTAPATVLESPYAFTSGAVTLAGTLTLPRGASGKVPVAVIVAGSGPTDRNGNSRLGLSTNTYAQLAWRLAERGIASVRYDKRGLGESGKNFDMAATTFDDFAADVAAAARALAADARFTKVVLIGHSEGAGLVVRAANTGAPAAGVALLAGVGRPLDVVIREQLAAQFDAAAMARFDRAWAAYLRGEQSTDDLPQTMQLLLVPVNRRFMQTSVAFHPAEELRRVRVPVLIVQGEMDVQVSVTDARALAAARPGARLVLIPDANHVFKHAASRDPRAQAAQYQDPTLPVVAVLVDTLAEWIGGLR